MNKLREVFGSRFDFLVCLVFATAFVFNIFAFLYSPNEPWNPDLPMWLKVAKDVPLGVFVFVPALILLIRGELSMSRDDAKLISIPILLSLFMLLIAGFKFPLSNAVIGILKNTSYYFAGSAFIVLLLRRWNREETLFNWFRLTAFVCLGVGVSFNVFASSRLDSLTFSGRMMSTLGNPNSVGFVALLMMILSAARFWYSQLSPHQASDGRTFYFLEMIVGGLSLVLSGSMAAMGCFVIWNLAMLAQTYLKRDRQTLRPLRRLLLTQWLAVFAFVVLALVVAKGDHRTFVFQKIESILSGHANGATGAFGVRINALQDFLDAATQSPTTLLWGHPVEKYNDYDGTFITWGVNFGLPLLFGWLAFWGWSALKAMRLQVRESSSLGELSAFVLSPLPFIFLFFYFWVQYLPEKYPTCLFIAWVTYQTCLSRPRRELA